MRYLVRTILLALFLTAFVRCAERIDADDVGRNEQESLDAWIKLNVPDALDLGEGGYYEWIERGPDDARSLSGDDWFRIDYTGYSFVNYDVSRHRGNVFMTRDESTSKIVGSFNHYTRYIPQIFLYYQETPIFRGQMKALGFMREGDVIRLYLPPELSASATDLKLTYSYGYGGNASYVPIYPTIVEMKLSEILEISPATIEQNEILLYLNNHYGDQKTFDLEDIIEPYLHRISEDESQPKIHPDSLVNIYYVGYLIEDGEKGFIFDTNIDSIGRRLERDTTNYSAMAFKAATMGNQYISAFTYMVEADTIRYGSWWSMALTSEWAYERTGREAGEKSSEIEPYASLIFDLYFPVKTEEEDEDE